MVHDVLEALNKTGFTEYNKDIEELVQQLVKNNSDKNKASKKKENKKNDIAEIDDDKDIKENVVDNSKEKID